MLVVNCDKIVPGHADGGRAAGHPFRHRCPAGPCSPGASTERTSGLEAVFEAVGRHAAGRMTDADLSRLECCACPGPGSCAGLFTANTMNCLSEALGIALPGQRDHPRRERGPRHPGARSRAGRRPRRPPGAHPAARSSRARRSSTPSHWTWRSADRRTPRCTCPAIAASAGVPLSLDDFDALSAQVPHLCSLAPSGPYYMQHLHSAGGVMAVHEGPCAAGQGGRHGPDGQRGRRCPPPMHERPSPTGSTSRSPSKPYHPEGGLAVLKGNLAPEGSIVKKAAVDPSMLVHEGPARVFDCEEDAQEAILGGKIAARRRGGHPLRGTARRPGHAGDALPHRHHCRASGWTRKWR